MSIRWALAPAISSWWELHEYWLHRWELGENCKVGFWSGENWLSIAHQPIVGGENWVSVWLEYFELMRIEWALHLEPLEVMKIGWALDFNNFNWWELGEHWTLTIWTGENWVSIELSGKWTSKFNILEMLWLVIEGCRPHKVSDRDSREIEV